MKIKRQQLDELVRLITRKVLKEYTAMSSDYDAEDGTDNGASEKPADAMTPLEKEKKRRDLKKKQDDAVKQKSKELAAKKDEMSYEKEKMDYLKRFDIPNLNRDLQAAKGAQI